MGLKSAIAVLIAAALSVLPIGAAQANWLTSLTKGAGKAAHHADSQLGPVGRAAGHVAELPRGTPGALAAHATPEGHWQFVNREGQVFTAGTPDEMTRVVTALLPAGAGDGKLALYLSEDSVFANSAALDALPKTAAINLVTGKGAIELGRDASGALIAKVKPNVTLGLTERRSFDDAMAFLARPLNKSNIRTLAIEPGGAKYLPSTPKIDADSKLPLVDAINPDHAVRAFASMRGQTALVVGRIDGAKITFQPSSGTEITRNLDELVEAARANDVNLILLHADTPRQPGGRNWFWQTVEIGGFSNAVSKSTFADFLDVLGARTGAMHLTASADGPGRVQLSAVAEAGGGAVEAVQSTLGELVGHVTGEIASQAISVHARDEERDSELDARLVPGVPTYIQVPYLVGLFAGLLCWAASRPLWQRIWPSRIRGAGEGVIVHALKRLPNEAAFFLVFLPIAGMPLFIFSMLYGLWEAILAPFRWVRKLLRRRVQV